MLSIRVMQSVKAMQKSVQDAFKHLFLKASLLQCFPLFSTSPAISIIIYELVCLLECECYLRISAIIRLFFVFVKFYRKIPAVHYACIDQGNVFQSQFMAAFTRNFYHGHTEF